ncbi:MAG TPA: hypothetical protein VE866_13230 [Candidatus Binatia bacterium]|nr:hypothetical protein [Candidatus Binatia bacterium]
MKFLNQLLHRACPHRFAWPRVGENGCHYQVCVICGTAYEYNWETMQRTTKLMNQPAADHHAAGLHPSYLR